VSLVERLWCTRHRRDDGLLAKFRSVFRCLGEGACTVTAEGLYPTTGRLFRPNPASNAAPRVTQCDVGLHLVASALEAYSLPKVGFELGLDNRMSLVLPSQRKKRLACRLGATGGGTAMRPRTLSPRGRECYLLEAGGPWDNTRESCQCSQDCRTTRRAGGRLRGGPARSANSIAASADERARGRAIHEK